MLSLDRPRPWSLLERLLGKILPSTSILISLTLLFSRNYCLTSVLPIRILHLASPSISRSTPSTPLQCPTQHFSKAYHWANSFTFAFRKPLNFLCLDSSYQERKELVSSTAWLAACQGRSCPPLLYQLEFSPQPRLQTQE